MSGVSFLPQFARPRICSPTSFSLVTLGQALASDFVRSPPPLLWRKYVYANKLSCTNFPVATLPVKPSSRLSEFVERDLKVVLEGVYEDWMLAWVMGLLCKSWDRIQLVQEIAKIVCVYDAEALVQQVLVFYGSSLSVEAFDRDALFE